MKLFNLFKRKPKQTAEMGLNLNPALMQREELWQYQPRVKQSLQPASPTAWELYKARNAEVNEYFKAKGL